MTVDPGLRGNSIKASFPPLYQAHHQDYTEDIPFWLRLARSQGDPILELGCGTGRVLFHLLDAGYTCLGLDNDPEMLAYLHTRTSPNQADQLTTILANMAAFKIQAIFPLILLPCNTFSTFDPLDRRSSLDCIYQHLTTGGVFSVSLPNPKILNSLKSQGQPEIEMILPHPETGNPVQVSYQIVRDADRVTFNWYYDHLFSDGQVDRLAIPNSHRLTTSAQYQNELLSAGFKIEATYGDFDCSQYKPDSPNLIFVVRKF